MRQRDIERLGDTGDSTADVFDQATFERPGLERTRQHFPADLLPRPGPKVSRHRVQDGIEKYGRVEHVIYHRVTVLSERDYVLALPGYVRSNHDFPAFLIMTSLLPVAACRDSQET